MNPIEQLQRNGQHLVVLDEDNVPVVRIGVRAAFHYAHGWTPEKRAAVTACHDHYRARYGDRLQFQTHPDTGKFSRLRANSVSLPTYLNTLKAGDGYETLLHSGPQPWAAPAFAFETSCASQTLFPLGHVAMSCDIDTFLQDIEGFSADFDAFVRALSPLYAHADIAILPSVSRRDMYQHIEYAWAQRAWGLDMETFSNRRYLEQTGLIPADLQAWRDLPDPAWLRIKGFNWLVYLNDAGCEQLGGRNALQAAHGTDGLTVHTLGHGLRLRAGDVPHLVPNATERQAEVPAAYTALSTLLRPLRTDGLALAQGAWFDEQITFNARTSRLWQARFDARAPGQAAPWPGPLMGEGTEHEAEVSCHLPPSR